MPIDEALSFLLKEKLTNIQLVEDFIDDSISETAKSSKLNQKIEEAEVLESLIKKRETLTILKLRKKELYKFKHIISKHIVQNESLETLGNLQKKINLLKRNLKKEEKSKRDFLNLINKKIRAKINSIRHKERLSNFYMIGKGIFTAISAGCGAVVSYFPIFYFILRPVQQGFNFLSYLSWQKAIENDQSISKEEQEIVRTKLNSIKKHNAGAAITGMLGGALLFLSAIIPPIAPITLALGIGAFLISNTLILVASLKDLYREIKHGKKDASRTARISSYIFDFASSISNTLATTLLLTAAILTLAFPPAAMAVAGAFAIVGLAFLAVNITSAVASNISLYVAHKKDLSDKSKPDLEMDEFHKNLVDFEVEENQSLINQFEPQDELLEKQGPHSKNRNGLKRMLGSSSSNNPIQPIIHAYKIDQRTPLPEVEVKPHKKYLDHKKINN